MGLLSTSRSCLALIKKLPAFWEGTKNLSEKGAPPQWPCLPAVWPTLDQQSHKDLELWRPRNLGTWMSIQAQKADPPRRMEGTLFSLPDVRPQSSPWSEPLPVPSRRHPVPCLHRSLLSSSLSPRLDCPLCQGLARQLAA